MTKLSVCIGTRNRSEPVCRHLRHLMSFAASDWEFVVSDNGSEDDTREKILALQREDPRIFYFRQQEPLEGAETVTAALALGRGAYLVSVADDDCLQEPGVLRAVQQLDGTPEIAAVYGRAQAITAGETREEALAKFTGTPPRGEGVFGQADMVRLFEQYGDMGMPVFRRRVFHASHSPLRFHPLFDFHGMSRFMKFGKVALIDDCLALTARQEEAESGFFYHIDRINPHISDYELFAGEVPPGPGVHTGSLVVGKLLGQYTRAARQAVEDGHFLVARHFLLRALAHGHQETRDQAAEFQRRHMVPMATEALAMFYRVTRPTRALIVEDHPDARPIGERMRTVVTGLPVEFHAAEALLDRPQSEEDLFLVVDGTLARRRQEVHGMSQRKLRTVENLYRAVRIGD